MAKWDLDSVKDEALKYSRRYDFYRGSTGAYQWASKNKVLDLCCGHMEAALTYHSLESAQKTALKYNTRNQFLEGDNSTYQAAVRNGWLEIVCGHMEVALTYHSLESIKATALKYNTRTRFLEGDNSTYNAAQRNGWLDLCCGHMERGVNGYDTSKPGTLYYLKIDAPNGDPLYKIGITNYPNVQDRIKTMQLYPGTTATCLQTICHQDGACIAKLEKYLHNKFEPFKYTGPNIMDNGNTELFTVDVSLSGPFEQYL